MPSRPHGNLTRALYGHAQLQPPGYVAHTSFAQYCPPESHAGFMERSFLEGKGQKAQRAYGTEGIKLSALYTLHSFTFLLI